MKSLQLNTLFSKPLLVVIVAFVCITLTSIVIGNTANAAVWNTNDGHGGFRTGYFGGDYAYYNLNGGNGYVLQEGIPGYVGDTGDTSAEINDFINYVWGKYDRFGTNGSEWRDRVGASFIIHSMIGKSQPQGSIDVSDAEYNEWVSRLRQPGISVNWGSFGSTTYDTYMNTNTDVARAEHGDNGIILRFYFNGAEIYALNRACANPDGALGGLPPPPPPPPPVQEWRITPSVEVKDITDTTSKSSAKIGSTITWNHFTANNSSFNAGQSINSHYQNRTSPGRGIGSWNDTVVSESGIGGSIKSLKSALCLDVEAASMKLVRQWYCNGTQQQIWRYDSSAQTLKLARDTARCLNATGSGNNATVNLVACNGRAEQKWQFLSSGLLKNTGYGKCMDAGNGGNADVAKTYDCRTASNINLNGSSQLWINGTEGDDKIYPASKMKAGFREVFTSAYKVTSADAGRTLCRSTSVKPVAWNNGNWDESNAACVYIPFDFDLVPAISSVNGAYQPGATIPDLTPSIDNTGKTRTDGAVEWQVNRIIVSPTGTISMTQKENSQTPCQNYGNSCGPSPVVSGNQEFPLGLKQVEKDGNKVFISGQTVPENAPVGTQVCFALSVRPYKVGQAWRHGVPSCIKVSKSPKVQVLGGDLIVGRGTASNSPRTSNVSTSTTTSAGLTYGSWSEYAIIPSGTVKGMASGALYVGGAASSNLCSLSVLTFSNTRTAGNVTTCIATSIGKFTGNSTAPNPASRFPVSTASVIPSTVTTQNIHALAPREVYTTTVSDLTLTSSAEFEVGRWVVLNAPNTTVTIADNINYTTGPISGIGQIPQVVIIAKNIIIKDSVEKIDAWLVASGGALQGSGAASRSINDGIINTCGAGTGITTTTLPNSNQCNKTLTINGPVMANHLLLRRTAGAGTGTDSGDPAEVFNLRADAYVWASAYSPGNGRIPTVDTKELPPRF